MTQLVNPADAHFLVWKLQSALAEVRGLKWNIDADLFAQGLRINLHWRFGPSEEKGCVQLDFEGHHPIHRDEYVDWIVTGVVDHLQHGLDLPPIEGEAGMNLRFHSGVAPRSLVYSGAEVSDQYPGKADGYWEDLVGIEVGGDDAADEHAAGEHEANGDLEESDERERGRSHPLYTEFGYSVAKKEGLAAMERRRRLTAAIDNLGYAEVERHLENLIEMNSRGAAAHWYRAAFRKWRLDLAWLERQQYED